LLLLTKSLYLATTNYQIQPYQITVTSNSSVFATPLPSFTLPVQPSSYTNVLIKTIATQLYAFTDQGCFTLELPDRAQVQSCAVRPQIFAVRMFNNYLYLAAGPDGIDIYDTIRSLSLI
jgi:hypothetical protein